METKHTPGPWFVERVEDGKGFVGSNEGGVGSKNDGIYIAHTLGPDRAANAELIAQAPTLKAQRDELLAALKAILGELSEAYSGLDTLPDDHPAKRTAMAAEATIKRAEGR